MQGINGENMRRLEPFKGARIIDDVWFVVQLDGRGFEKLTKNDFTKPFDENLITMMCQTSAKLMEEFECIYAYTINDEISLLFRKNFQLYERQVEKLISILSSAASSEMTFLSGKRVQFHGKILALPNHQTITDYFVWRQDEGYKDFLSDTAYWQNIQSGIKQDQAKKELNYRSQENKIIHLVKNGINILKEKSYIKRGTGFIWENYKKKGYNPKTDKEVLVDRRRVIPVSELPLYENYVNFILQQLK